MMQPAFMHLLIGGPVSTARTLKDDGNWPHELNSAPFKWVMASGNCRYSGNVLEYDSWGGLATQEDLNDLEMAV